MPIRGRVLIENAAYHVTTRGNHKKKVFYEDADYIKFLGYLKRYKNKYDIRVYAYCLMPNHIHILAAPKDKDKLKKIMHCLNLSYCKYFNLKYGKNGHLWQGRYKSNVILQDQYLINCATYIEMNPVRAKLCARPEDYKWSSYRYRALGKKDGIIDDFIV
jgi:putative transposase